MAGWNKMVFPRQYIFCSRDWGLLHQSLNELLLGFGLRAPQTSVGMSADDLMKYLRYLNGLPDKAEIPIDLPTVAVMAKVLKETLRELGEEEFHTRTGYGFVEGEALLAKLQTLVDRGLE
jgi:hypothetical protein